MPQPTSSSGIGAFFNNSKTAAKTGSPRNFPRAPRYPDTDKALRAAGGAADRYQLLAAGRLVRARRLAELERALEGCR